ncbi:unnamed protein product [Phytomonas sp. Hart1]|nr:unnamed protein product [Phytomonas sp. Hart1]|eukprot:CCW67509.1 unnamed protein product [Phytomonas sp. isolate Hart1]
MHFFQHKNCIHPYIYPYQKQTIQPTTLPAPAPDRGFPMDVHDTKEVELFGGAMRCRVPRVLQNVSDFRQVPDHQEVLHDLSTGATLIVELLARQREVRDDEAARFFYYDLAKANGCTPEGVRLETLAVLPPSAYAALTGLPLLNPSMTLDSPHCPVTTPAVAVTPVATGDGGGHRGTTGPGGQGCAYACLATGIQKISKFTNEAGRENDVFVGLAVLRFRPPVAAEVLVSLSCPVVLHPDSSDAAVVKRLLRPEERDGVIRRALQTLEVQDWGLFVPEEE